MKVLITGGAGFIGSHLAERCLSENWSVSVVDDFSTGSFENISEFRNHPGFSYYVDSIFNFERMFELVGEADIIFHLAAAVGVRLVVQSPVRTIETNVHGTEVVLRAAARQKKRVLIASTSEVYGKSTNIPFREDADLVMGPTTSPRWSYACSKMLDEFLGLAYGREQGVPVVVVRFFNTVGPRQTGRYGMVLPSFVRQALRGEPLTVFGTGAQKRCFGYVGDIVEALMRICTSPDTPGEVINIGSNEEISILDLAKKVKEITGSQSEISFVPYDEAYGPGFEDVLRRVPSLEKLVRLTGYRPSTPLDSIVESVVEDIASRIDDPAAA